MDRSIYDNYVLMIAQHGSLTKAATALGISQPALSSGLNTLEKSLGFKVFNRKSNPISFTSEGRVYFDYIKRIKVLNDDFNSRIKAMRSDMENSAVIGGPSVYVESMLADAVIRLRKDDPEYRVSIKTASLPELIQSASEGEINCFISTSADIPENFKKILVRSERIFLVIPDDDPVNEMLSASEESAGSAGDIDFSVLSGQKMIFLEPGQPLQKMIDRFLSEYSVKADCIVTVDQVSAALSLALRGAGICFASGGSLNGKINLDGVKVYPLPDDIFERKIYMAYDPELYMPRACTRLIEILAEGK